MRVIWFFIAGLCLPLLSRAQMVVGSDTLYGNEWIKYENAYLRIKVAADGIYRIPTAQLTGGAASVPASALRLYRYGVQVPIFTSTNDIPGNNDFVEFWGESNKDAIDRHLADDPDAALLNPQYSLFNDTVIYYLTWNDGTAPARMTPATNDLSNLPPKTEWGWVKASQVFSNNYFKREISADIAYSWYDGDGWGNYYTNTVLNQNLPNMYMAGPPATLSFRTAYQQTVPYDVRFEANDSLIVEESHFGFQINQYNATLSNSRLNGQLNLKVNIEGHGSNNNVVGGWMSGIDVRYARAMNFDNASTARFELDANPAGHYLEIAGFNAGAVNPVLYDLNTSQRWETTVEGGLVKVFLPGSAQARKLVLFNPANGVLTVPAPSVKNFRNFTSDNAGFLIITANALLNDPTANGANQVQAYANYRASNDGGNYTTAIVDVEELYEQFAYGIRFHPISIRNFCHYVDKKWPKAKHVLLIGKGLNADAFRKPADQQNKFNQLYFLPNFGAIGTDLLYLMRGAHLETPILTVGRLAVTKPFEIKNYLDKVVEHEQLLNSDQTIENKLGFKRFLHISGGQANEQASIASLVQGLNEELNTGYIGATVKTLYKTSNDPIQKPPFDQISEATKEGLSTMMVFGHSSPFLVDYDIGTPDHYENKGKYPFMLILGCFSGQCSNTDKGLGENFVLERNKGALAYLAPVNYGFTDGLSTYGRTLYRRMGGTDYGKSLGEIINGTADTLIHHNTSTSTLIAVLHQSQLQGDPAIRLHQSPGPDFTTDRTTVVVSPNPVSVEQPTFQVSHDLVNIGKRVGGTVRLKYSVRDAADSLRVLKVIDVDAPAFREKINVELPTTGIKSGYGRLFIAIDPEMQLEEWPSAAKLNNDLADASGEKGIPLYFYADDIQPVYPPDFSIVFTEKATLHASTLSPRPASVRYLFEIDSTESFNSPILKQYNMASETGALSWTPDIPLRDSAVYYWRVARDSLVNGLVPWHTRSFTYIKGSRPGWSQSDNGQFLQDSLLRLDLNGPGGEFAFFENTAQMKYTLGYMQATPHVPSIANSYNEGAITPYQWGTVNGISNEVIIMELDPLTGRVIKNPAGEEDNPLDTLPALFHGYEAQDSLSRLKLMDYLQTGLTPGAYVLFMTVYDYSNPIGYNPWAWGADSVSYGKNLFQILEGYGAKKVRSLANATNPPYPYAFSFRYQGEGFPPSDTIVYFKDTLTTVRRNFPALWLSGTAETEIIGPARKWHSAVWQKGPKDDPTETYSISVFGVRNNQPDTLLYQAFNETEISLANVDSTQFRYLKLKYEALDTLQGTPVALHSWWVFYDGYPEGTLNRQLSEWHSDTLSQGDSLRATMSFRNISWYNMDSLLIRYTVQGPAGQSTVLNKRLDRLPAGDSIVTSLRLPTNLLNGPQRLSIDVNPDNDQPELHHYNNIGIRNFYVGRDRRNPLLDVTFDGIYIMDGDLISPKPNIVLTLKDDNPYLGMQDTTTFTLKVTEPDGNVRQIAWNDPEVLFIPADASNLPQKNRARLEWRPTFAKDGDYVLSANGRDASGNLSASLDYAVNFRVITRSSISNVLNYPNPFSTSTCFVYTMTGSETPAFFKIQIMTVSGRVVREITTAEFGPLLAGTHRSNFCWDGRDEFGDQLANGVYLYRVVAKKQDGSDFEAFQQDNIDGFFKHGFGKMVLMR